MLSGEVTVTGRRGTVTLKQGQGTMLFGGGKPQRAAAWPAGRLKRAVASITFGNPPFAVIEERHAKAARPQCFRLLESSNAS